ncbi:MAG: sensor histidine kinase [Myxococcota bacterium]
MSTSAQRPRRVRDVVATVGLVGLATGLGLLVRPHLAEADFVMLYLLAIVTAATRFGRGPALVASALSVLAFDFFFVTPHLTFEFSEQRHLLTFITMFVVGLIISALAEAARTAARKAQTEELRSSILSAVSHDLRTPLAAITGAATTLRERWPGLEPSQREELVGAICDEAERLERLVGNLLDMSRLEAGVLELKREWVPLEEMVGVALERLEVPLRHRRVSVALPEALPLVSVDAVLLEQVFVNLLENAVKYTPADAALWLSARALDGAVEVTLDDAGPGLPPGTEQRIFEKFYRASPERGSGAGLGLAIARGIVEAHGGTLTAGPSPQGGARFTLTLPLPGEAPVVPAEQEPGRSPA